MPVRLREALRLERKVEILYQVPERAPERRIVWPIVIAFFERAPVLAAWCELRAAHTDGSLSTDSPSSSVRPRTYEYDPADPRWQYHGTQLAWSL